LLSIASILLFPEFFKFLLEFWFLNIDTSLPSLFSVVAKGIVSSFSGSLVV